MAKQKQKPEFIGDLAVMPEHGIIFSLAETDPVNPASSPKPEKLSEIGTSDVAVWGETNDLPQLVIEAVDKDTELPALLDYKGRLLQGRQVVAVNLVYNQETKEFDQHHIDDPVINKFLQHRTFKRYWREACVDFTWWGIIFPDLIKSKDGNSIAYLGTHEAAWCRFNKQDKNGLIKKCYVSAHWPNAKPEDEETATHEVVDPYNPELIENLKGTTGTNRFVYPVNYPTPGKAYYPTAAWISYVFSEWFKLKQLIPKQKRKLLEKVLSAKYILSIPTNYWATQNKDWGKLTTEQRLAIKKAKVKEINDKITGIDASGNVILCEVGYDDQQKEIPGFKITPIENNIKSSENIDVSQEASEHGMRSLSVDQTLVGEGPGKKNGGGSGSDKRIAFNIQVALLTPYREVILEPLYFKAEYDGWLDKYPNLRFKVEEVQLETLDKNHQTQKETTS